MKEEVDVEPHRTDWERMLTYVHREIRLHPALAPMQNAQQTVLVHAHAGAIFATAVREPQGSRWLIEVRIERPEWWLPVSRRHGNALVKETGGRSCGEVAGPGQPQITPYQRVR